MQTSTTKSNARYCCRLLSTVELFNNRNQIERKFITALENDDVPMVEQMLSSEEISLPHKIGRHPVQTLIMRTLSPNMIKMAVRKYPDIFLGRSDRFVELIDCWRNAEYGSPMHWVSASGTNTWQSDKRAFEIIELLIELHRENTSSMDLIHAVFSASDEASPFTRACKMTATKVVMKFLDLITDESREHLREEWFDGKYTFGEFNLFHYANLPADLVKLIIDRLPFSRSMLNRPDSVEHPLFTVGIFNKAEGVKIAPLYVLHGGARVDPLNQRGITPLLAAIERGDLEMVECFLRMGACTDIVDPKGKTALSMAMRFGDGSTRRDAHARNISWRMIELLLAFGVDLGKEACLRTLLPPNPNNKSLRGLLCGLRYSNSMNALARLCRKVIRRQMGPNADEKIKEEVTDIPQHLKAYLLVENEPPVLDGQFGQ